MIGFRVLIGDDTNVDSHVIPQVLVPGDQSDSVFVFEADSTGGRFVYAVEILDRGDDGIGCIVRKDLDPHRDSSLGLGGIIQEQLKRHMLGRWRRRRGLVGHDVDLGWGRTWGEAATLENWLVRDRLGRHCRLLELDILGWIVVH